MRVALAVVAVAALVWLGIVERDTRLQASAERVLHPGASAAQLRKAETDLRAARTLNPDTQPRIDLALLDRARGRTRRAIAAMDAVVHDEPDDLVAWGVLSVMAQGTDAGAVRRAQAAAQRLDPFRAARRARSAAP